MNGRKHPWKRLIAAMLAALLIGQIIPAYAVEPDGEPELTPQAMESPATAPDDVGANTDTPEPEAPVEGPETALVTVSTLEELLQAIDEAEAGATIGLAGLIDLEPDTILGSPDKLVIIQRVDTGSNTGFQRLPDQTVTGMKVQNIIFDGAGISCGALFAIAGDIIFENVTFQNCNSYGTTFSSWGGNAQFIDCVFDSNRGSAGAHINASAGGLCHLKGCTLKNGYSSHTGGAIQTGGLGSLLNIENTTITGNYADTNGGGAGSLTRAELALLVVSMMDQAEPAADPPPFDDVDAGSPYAAAIGTTFSTGIMVGYGNGRFGPEGVLTWAELITVFSRFAGDDIPPEVFTGQHWAKDAINTAISLGWLEYSEAFDLGGVVTCGEAVAFIQTVFQWASD